MTYLAFVRKERRLLSFAVSFTFFSSFGQTFLISLFVPYYLIAFGLSNASFGTLYAAATLTGAVALPWLGQWIDHIPLRRYSMYVAAGLLVASALMAVAWHIAILFLSLILLRLAGQGLSGHTAQTTMARYDNRQRGKALSISSLGYPLGEALLPSMLAGLLAFMHWRTAWALIAGVIAVLFIPFLWALVKRERGTASNEISVGEDSSAIGNYRVVFTDPRTPFIIPAILIPPFWVTGLFLYQVSAGNDLGWSAGLIASSFIAFAVARILAGLASGFLIDRFSAQSLFPFILIPIILGLLAAVLLAGSWSVFVYMALIGATLGFSGTLKPALWAELFGIERIGTVQSLFASMMVFSTALSPFLVGWLLDQSVSMHTIFLIALISSVIAALLSIKLLPVFQKGRSRG